MIIAATMSRALSASREQQIRQMVWGRRGVHFQNIRCEEDAASNKDKYCMFPSSGRILLGWWELDKCCCCRGINMWVQIKTTDRLKAYLKAFLLFFTNNISTRSLGKYLLNWKTVGAGPADQSFSWASETTGASTQSYPSGSSQGLIQQQQKNCPENLWHQN